MPVADDPRLGPNSMQVLNFIRQYVAEEGMSPSIREIGDGIGIHSTGHLAYHLNRLVALGYLVHKPHRARSFQLTSLWCPSDQRGS